jgi:hypothetical protein
MIRSGKYVEQFIPQRLEITLSVSDTGVRTICSAGSDTGSKREHVTISWVSGPFLPSGPVNEEELQKWLEALRCCGYRVEYASAVQPARAASP